VKAERWQRIQEIFDAATELPRHERREYVQSESQGDDDLVTDVLAMLAADESAGDFIETAVRGATTSFAENGDPTKDLKKFGKYEIIGWIGEGGFSQVHKGRDPVLQREVAIKTCTASSRDLRKRFYREAKIAAALQHPNIVTVHDLGVENRVPFLVQEFLSGDDLATRIAGGKRVEPATAVDHLIQVARGLEYAHRKGVLHRDIKPSNIQALNSGRVKILDFGIARFLEEDNPLTDQGAPIGTAGYQSPEQLEGAELDRRTDIFSFGVLAYELIASSRPFPGRSFAEVYHKVLHSEPTPLRKIVKDCPVALESLISTCLQNDRNNRPKNFTQVLQALEEIARTLPPPENAGSHLATVEFTQSRRWRVIAVSAATLFATAIGWIAWTRNDSPAPEPEVAVDSPYRGGDETGLPPRFGLGAPQSGPFSLPAETATSPDNVRADPASSERPGATTPGGETGAGSSSADPTEAASPPVSRNEAPGPVTSPAPADTTRDTPGVDRRENSEAEPLGGVTEVETAEGTSEETPTGPPNRAPNRAPDSPTESATLTAGSESDPSRAESQPLDSQPWEETDPPVIEDSTPPPGEILASQPAEIPESATASGVGIEESKPELLEPLELEYPSKTDISLKERTLLSRLDSVHINLNVLVDESGGVRLATVRDTNEPGSAYQEAALAVVKKARFRPGTIDGKPALMWTLLSLDYPQQ